MCRHLPVFPLQMPGDDRVSEGPNVADLIYRDRAVGEVWGSGTEWRVRIHQRMTAVAPSKQLAIVTLAMLCVVIVGVGAVYIQTPPDVQIEGPFFLDGELIYRGVLVDSMGNKEFRCVKPSSDPLGAPIPTGLSPSQCLSLENPVIAHDLNDPPKHFTADDIPRLRATDVDSILIEVFEDNHPDRSIPNNPAAGRLVNTVLFRGLGSVLQQKAVDNLKADMIAAWCSDMPFHVLSVDTLLPPDSYPWPLRLEIHTNAANQDAMAEICRVLLTN